MSDVAIVRAAVFLARSCGERPSVRLVDTLIRAARAGKSFKKQRLVAMIAEVLSQNGTPPAPPGTEGTQISFVPGTIGNRREPPGTPKENKTRDRGRETDAIASSSPPVVSQPTETHATPPKRQRKARSEPDGAWLAALAADLAAIDARELRTLSSAERLVLAREHCRRFANCTRDGPANAKRALPVAAGIANVASEAHLGTLQASEYLGLMDRAWKAAGEAPNFRPWSITAMLEPHESEELWRRHKAANPQGRAWRPQAVPERTVREDGRSSGPRSGERGLQRALG